MSAEAGTIMKTYQLLMILGLSLASMSACASDALTNKEAYIIVDKLLSIGPTGNSAKAKLERYREWGNLYNTYWQRMKSTDSSDADLRVYLFIVFAAYESASSDITEHVGETFLEIFERKHNEILDVLRNRRFLIGSTCKAIDSGFSLADSKEDEVKLKTEFMEKYKHVIEGKLSWNKSYQKCFMEFDDFK